MTIIAPNIDEATEAYYVALQFVQTVDAMLERGIHLRDCEGRLLTTLDQVMTAIAAGKLRNNEQLAMNN